MMQNIRKTINEEVNMRQRIRVPDGVAPTRQGHFVRKLITHLNQSDQRAFVSFCQEQNAAGGATYYGAGGRCLSVV